MSRHTGRITPSHRFLVFVVFALLLTPGAALHAQTALASPPTDASLTSAKVTLTSAEVVDQMLRNNRDRAEELKHYQSLRHYAVNYKGYAVNLGATLTVEADYDAVSGKTFRIVSQSGSKLLVDKVLKRL